MANNKTVSYLIIIISSIALLVIGKDLLIPFILALLIWFLIVDFRRLFEKIPGIGQKLPRWIWTVISSFILFIICGLIVNLLAENIQDLSQNIPEYEKNLLEFNETIKTQFDIDIEEYIENYTGDFEFSGLLKNLFSSLSDLFGNAFMIILYVLFIFLEESVFGDKIKAMFTSPDKYNDINSTLQAINKSISSYITLKTIISLITGLGSYIALYFIGIDTPIFWAFLIFLLNYIPTIGSLIGTLFPAVIALLQFGDITYFILVIAIVGAVQLIVGNIVEPKVMGNSLNLSPLAVIIALSLWGALWGITGMVLSVPITVIMVILFAQFKGTRSIAILLSERGKV